MKLETVQSVVAVLSVVACVMNLSLAFGAPPSIGTVIANGSFRVDDAMVVGNATLFEGTTIETHQVRSSLDLATGTHVFLDAESKGRIFGDRLLLEKGSGEMRDAAGFQIDARGLSVRTETGRSAARILLAGTTRLQVAALAGSLRVLNSHGLLVAALNTGMALEFDLQKSGEPEKLTGCLRAVPGHYLVTDEVTNVTVEVAGPGLDRESGNHVEVTGVMDPTGAPVSGATQYIRVTVLKHLGKGCGANRAVPAGKAGGGAAAKAGGVLGGLTTTTIAVIGGVAAAAVVGGLAASGNLSSPTSGSSLSR